MTLLIGMDLRAEASCGCVAAHTRRPESGVRALWLWYMTLLIGMDLRAEACAGAIAAKFGGTCAMSERGCAASVAGAGAASDVACTLGDPGMPFISPKLPRGGARSDAAARGPPGMKAPVLALKPLPFDGRARLNAGRPPSCVVTAWAGT
eukprot:NODE_21167_length_766_cov_2.308294.p4 GENE.NODE_21167_length_766_cov_2.308294~~NODE_21167_length_766_cov_2.308294.p4  ORF type:complete len:150 (+),score=33.65 NODE_21167_length_766_cov_2.308294:240-689(+)